MDIFFINLFFITAFIFLSYKVSVSGFYDWDIDQFMYGASRLINGELPWINEFDDKLPILHYIFSLPAYFKNLYPWIIFNILLTLLTGLFTYKLIRQLIIDSYKELKPNLTEKICFTSTCFYLFLIVFTQGSLIHINALCSNLTLLIIYLLYKKNNYLLIKSPRFILASLLASITISLRPYLLLPILVFAFWKPLRNYKTFKNYNLTLSNYKFQSLRYAIFWILYIFVWGVILNFLPYIFTNNIDIFIDTLKLNSIEYGSGNTIISQFNTIKLYPYYLVHVFIFFSCAFISVFNLVSRKNTKFKDINYYKMNIDILFFGILSPLLLEQSFISRHFFPHYINLFSSFIAVSSPYLIVNLISFLEKRKIQKKLLLYFFRFSFVFILSIILVVKGDKIISVISNVGTNGNYERTRNLAEFENFLISEKLNKKINFLFPMSNFYHWKFSEPRHGFPMAAVYRNIATGKFDKVLDSTKEIKYKNILPRSENLCHILNSKGPEIIISYYGDFTYYCLKNNSSYSLDNNLKSMQDRNFYIFRSNDKKKVK